MNRLFLFFLGVVALFALKLMFFSSDAEIEKVESIEALSMVKDDSKQKIHHSESVEIRYEKPSKSLNSQPNENGRDEKSENIYVKKTYVERADRDVLDAEQESREVENEVIDDNQEVFDREYIESNINSGELEPLFKDWKKNRAGVKYNI